jgi:hypothetical protein
MWKIATYFVQNGILDIHFLNGITIADVAA